MPHSAITKRFFEDGFVGTIYDDDQITDEEEAGSADELPAQTNLKKRKRVDDESSRKKKKPGKEDIAVTSAPDNADGSIDPGFIFQLEDEAANLDDELEWLGGGKQDDVQVRGIDEIVSARKKAKAAVVSEEEEEIDAELSDEEMLADDAFGMGVGSDDGEDEEDNDDAASDANDDREDESDADDGEEDDIAKPQAHPDDLEGDSSDGESQVDEAEDERKKAFFAPESDLTTPNAIETGAGSFMSFHLSRPILKGLFAAGFNSPTPIQARTIPMALEGKDVVGSAVTGSGKTGAFMIPILDRLFYRSRDQPTTRVVVLTPTRELALQAHMVAEKLAKFTDITFGQAIGGMNQKVQEAALKLRPDIVIATPGRFIDFMRNSSALQMDRIEILVLDEADRMLEDGFADELNEILTSLPKSRQTMLFSATMTSSVDDLIRVGCSRPVRLAVDSSKQTVKGLVQHFVRLRPGREHLRLPYLLHLCTTSFHSRTIIFFRQKALAHRVRVLFALCNLSATELHGALSQDQRIQAVEAFRSGKAAFLLATDLASRGLDIKNVDVVINYDAPQSHEIYLHRVGRTARAGRSGRAVTIAAEPDRKVVKAAVKAARKQGAIVKPLSISPDDSAKWEKRVTSLEDEIEAVLREEKEEKVLKQTEMQARKAENIMTHEKDILARPKKTWFQGEKDKQASKEKGRTALNGTDPALSSLDQKTLEILQKQKKGKLSNKQKKKLALKDERNEGRMWKKGSEQRGKGGDLSQMKDKKKKKGKASKAK